MLHWVVLNRNVNFLKMDMTLNDLQRLICHKTQTKKQTNNKISGPSLPERNGFEWVLNIPKIYWIEVSPSDVI